MKERLRHCALGALTLLLVVAAPAAAHSVKHKAKASHAHYYLALGDSLSVGYQPNAAGVGLETNQGYANDLAAYYAKQVKGLKFVDLGCPGESTGSAITGTGNAQAVAAFHCPEPQLSKALAFLKAHHAKGEVPLITIDLGANDVDGCATGPIASLSTCIAQGIGAIKTNLPKILTALRKAAPKGTRFAAMNLYDPVLAAYLAPYNPLNPLAEASLQFLTAVNATLGAVDSATGFKTADVATAFNSAVTTPVPTPLGPLPANVATLCSLTWNCTPAPQGPNIHANAAGYAVIAKAFEAVVGRL